LDVLSDSRSNRKRAEQFGFQEEVKDDIVFHPLLNHKLKSTK
jgi:hypothetical protein